MPEVIGFCLPCGHNARIGVVPRTFSSAVISFATDPDSDGAALSPDFVRRLDAALAAPVPVLHLWHAQRAPLDAARDAALHALRGRGLSASRCQAGEFGPLLHTLNTLIADSLRGAPLPSAQQAGVWLVDEAERLSAEHQLLIERIFTHFPELPLRLLLLSQAPLAPPWPAPAQTLEVGWRQAAPQAPTHAPTHAQAQAPEWQPEEDLRPARATVAQVPHAAWWLGGAALLALAAGGAWWGLGGLQGLRSLVGRSAGVSAPPPAQVASAPEALPASALASQAAASAASEAAAGAAPVPALPASATVSAATSAVSATTATPTASAAASSPVSAASLARPMASAPLASASAAPAKVAASGPWRAWLQALPEGSWLVLHAQFASAREAEAFKASDPLLANARIVQAVWTEGQAARFGVLTGPFRSPERVANYLLRLAWREQARSLSREELLKP